MSPVYLSSIIVMGVAGCGKSTVGALLARRLHAEFVDADDLHSADAVAKMAAGNPLTDVDRAPWLDRVAERVNEILRDGGRAVVACSAPRRRYRERLRAATRGGLYFVHLSGDVEQLTARMIGRADHFMPATLLHSQLEALEELGEDEDGTRVSTGGRGSALAGVDAACRLGRLELMQSSTPLGAGSVS